MEERPHAVQCKFRSRGIVSWRDLSTFEALCARTGPWRRHLVMTNASAVKRQGLKQAKDLTFARGTFMTLSRHEWTRLAGFGRGRTVGGETSPVTARRVFLDNITR
jgi:hypothetical protein